MGLLNNFLQLTVEQVPLEDKPLWRNRLRKAANVIPARGGIGDGENAARDVL